MRTFGRYPWSSSFRVHQCGDQVPGHRWMLQWGHACRVRWCTFSWWVQLHVQCAIGGRWKSLRMNLRRELQWVRSSLWSAQRTLARLPRKCRPWNEDLPSWGVCAPYVASGSSSHWWIRRSPSSKECWSSKSSQARSRSSIPVLTRLRSCPHAWRISQCCWESKKRRWSEIISLTWLADQSVCLTKANSCVDNWFFPLKKNLTQFDEFYSTIYYSFKTTQIPSHPPLALKIAWQLTI